MNFGRTISAFAVVLMGLTLPSTPAAAQQTLKEQIVGSWTFVSSTTKLPDRLPLLSSEVCS
jgi:hypothetical protein